MTRLFTIHGVNEDTPVQFVGVYTLRWRPEWGEPTAMFAEVDDPVYDAAPELSAVCKDKLGSYESPANTLRAIAETFDEKTPWHMWLRRKAAQMDAAIAKAEGKQ